MLHIDFSHSAENVTFSIEGGGAVPVLRTFLRSRDGEEFSRDVNLAERIENHNGQFVYGMYPLAIGALQRLLLIYDQFKCYML